MTLFSPFRILMITIYI